MSNLSFGIVKSADFMAEVFNNIFTRLVNFIRNIYFRLSVNYEETDRRHDDNTAKMDTFFLNRLCASTTKNMIFVRHIIILKLTILVHKHTSNITGPSRILEKYWCINVYN